MTENKRFTIDRFDLLEYGEPVTVEEVCDLLKELSEENEKLTKALLLFMDVAYVETSSNWYESMNTACQKIFKKSYDEIHEVYKGIGTDEEVFELFDR